MPQPHSRCLCPPPFHSGARMEDLSAADAGIQSLLTPAAAAAAVAVKPAVELINREFGMFLDAGDSIGISELQRHREEMFYKAIVNLDNIVSSLQVSLSLPVHPLRRPSRGRMGAGEGEGCQGGLMF